MPMAHYSSLNAPSYINTSTSTDFQLFNFGFHSKNFFSNLIQHFVIILYCFISKNPYEYYYITYYYDYCSVYVPE